MVSNSGEEGVRAHRDGGLGVFQGRQVARDWRRGIRPAARRGDSSVGVPPSEAFEGLAKSYHGWMPRMPRPGLH